MPLKPLTAALWKSAVKRFKPRAAKGPDAFARLDLLQMPSARTDELLSILCDIENYGAPWPRPMLEGFVLAHCKHNGKTDTGGYRPLCLYSMVYRCWAGLRARQALQWIGRYISAAAHGFLPGKESAQVWYGLGAQIELAFQGEESLCGFSVDFARAFNTIPRQPLFETATWLGLPAALTTPWKSFLLNMKRRFMFHGQVGDQIQSATGFPEGCPLSTVAMGIIDFMYHAYMDAFTPQLRSVSYVDNLLGTGPQAIDVA